MIQGHVLLSPTSVGYQLNAQAPSVSEGGTVPLNGVHVNGVVYAAGDMTVSRAARVYGAVIAEGSLISTDTEATLEVWHNDDLSRSLYRGIPLVHRAPGTWSVRY